MTKTNYKIRQALPSDINSALDLALRVFIEFEMPDYEPQTLTNFKSDCIDNVEYRERVRSGSNFMFVTLDRDKIIGTICERGNGHISMLFVDENYHRKGIAMALIKEMIAALKLQEFEKVTLNSSPYGLPFYEHFGFTAIDKLQHKDGFIFMPMQYIIVSSNA
ncbi:MAG: GNAT family N-acetyltransferase [Oscillospiraceae bacterium]|jgi:predicted N-acetyltransferase YhbS|nr:GNAT family N-acetyltransferase [Oscillospiraceae bacterium]